MKLVPDPAGGADAFKPNEDARMLRSPMLADAHDAAPAQATTDATPVAGPRDGSASSGTATGLDSVHGRRPVLANADVHRIRSDQAADQRSPIALLRRHL